MSSFTFKFSGLRARLIIMVFLALAPMIGLTVYSIFALKQIESEEARAVTTRLTEFVALHFEDKFIDGRHLLAVLSRLSAVHKLDPADCDASFSKFWDDLPENIYVNILAVRPNGDVFCSVKPLRRSVNVSDKEWFRRTLKRRDFAVGDYQIGRITKQPVMVLGYPVLDEKNRLLSIVALAMDFSWLAKFVMKGHLPKGASLILADRNGKIIAHHPHPKKFIGKSVPWRAKLKDALALDQIIIFKDTGHDKKERLIAVRKVTASDSAFLSYAAVSIPTAVAFQEIETLVFFGFIGLGLTVILGFLIPRIYAARFILRPLNSLMAATDKLSEGDLGTRSGMEYKDDEMGQLARSFDQMAGRLERRDAQLAYIQETMSVIASSLDQDRIFKRTTEAAVHFLGLDMTRIWILDDQTGDLSLGASAVALGVPEISADELLPPRGGLIRHVLESKEPHTSPDLLADPHILNKEWVKRHGYVSQIVVPLLAGDLVLGALAATVRRAREFTDDERELLTTLATQAAVAIQNARLHEESEHSRDFLDSVVVGSQSPVIAADRERKIILWNPGAESLYGYTGEEALGKDLDLIIPLNRLEERERIGTDIWSNRKAFRIETERLRKDGTVVPVDLTISPVIQDGKVVATAGIHTDLTERKRAEESLRANEERTRSIVESAYDGIVTIDERGSIESVNRSGLEIFGYEPEEVVGQNVRMLMPEPFSGEHDSYLSSYLITGEKKIIGIGREVVGIRKGGEIFDMELNISETRVEDRRVFIGTIRDITERKRAEEEITRVAHDLTQLIDTANAPIFGVDEEGRVNEWNQTVARLTGYGKEEAMGRDLVEEFITEDYKAPVREILERALRGDETSNYELPLFTKEGGKRVLVLLNATTRRDAAGGVVGVIGIGQDITELQRTQEMVARAEKLSSIGTLTAGAAHEILNPANIIGIHAQQMLRRTEEGSEDHEAAEGIYRNVERITRICDDLRRFSRDEAPVIQKFDPDKIIEDSIGMLAHELRLASVRSYLELHGEGVSTMGDPNQLQQVIFNLIGNAKDAMPTGGDLTIVTAAVADKGGRWWECRVSDTGTGIPLDALPRLFDPFFTTKPADKGTGLGLAVSYGIVESHGGKIWAENNLDAGASFIIHLPLAGEVD